MIITSIRLQNIRSYVSEAIVFPEGSVILSGDVGAGKSTILLAIEFALFGVLRGALDGTALLRNGSSSGSVEIDFSVDGKKVIIKRTLKRGKNSVSQDAGYIITDGVKNEGTAVELKSRVLDLLGYPKELLSKSKDLIYLYTVYTPQEEMKRILFDEGGHRIGTLRTVFQIDKYERVGSNTVFVVRALKEKIREFEGQISDLGLKNEQREKLESDLGAVKKRVEDFSPLLAGCRQKIAEKQEAISGLEHRIKELNELKSSVNVLSAKLREKTDFLSSIIEEANMISRKILEFNQQAESLKLFEEPFAKKVAFMKKKVSALNEKISVKDDLKKSIARAEDDLNKILAIIREHEVLKESAERTMAKIVSFDSCPLCLQPVSSSHRQQILQAEKKKVSEALKVLEGKRLLREEVSDETADLKKKLDEVIEQEKLVAQLMPEIESFGETIAELGLGFQGEIVMSIKEELPRMKAIQKKLREQKRLAAFIHEKEEAMKQMFARQAAVSSEIARLKTEQDALKEKEKSFENIDGEYENSRKKMNGLQSEEKQLLVSKASLDKELENIEANISLLGAEIERKNRAKDRLKELKKTQSWFEDFFMNLMEVIEKQVMLRVHNEFNSLFQEWFGILMEDETMSARLDDEFSPVIEQNGYETSIQNLSGGERTGCALAYRLALNRVINNLVTGIKTSDLIILDEPTDGFSSEQLEKVRDVIEQLNIKQIIIVSHESKIESFVNSIIKIEKQGHISSVA